MSKRIRHPKPPKLVQLPPPSQHVVNGPFVHTADHVLLTYHPPEEKREEKDGQKV